MHKIIEPYKLIADRYRTLTNENIQSIAGELKGDMEQSYIIIKDIVINAPEEECGKHVTTQNKKQTRC